MPLFEYSKWDGSQEFQAQSADNAFDQFAEYLLQYGDQVLRQLDEFEDDDQPDVLKKLQEEGYIEEDGEGRFVVAPKGLRRIQNSALTDLFEGFRRDCPRGLEALRLRRFDLQSESSRDNEKRDDPARRWHADPRPSR
jgi:Ca-activated chloride channel family protein